ncbi:MAG: MtN3/saliva-related transrane protein conserved region [Fibrobacteria bacterium]|jgi:MtN3 and saliva related transmembrane protein|nr:MtN3/saliva-related transrane protein conserved region [Fibrobacteria bacterium]
MTSLDFLGLFAAALTSLSFIPQVVKTVRTGDTSAISLFMYALFVFGIACWLVWGILAGQMPVVAANAVTLVLSSMILGLKVRAVVARKEKP